MYGKVINISKSIAASRCYNRSTNINIQSGNPILTKLPKNDTQRYRLKKKLKDTTLRLT